MKPGFYQTFDVAEYHNDPCETPSLNYSTAKEIIKRSPWAAWKKHARLGGERFKASAQMDAGSIVHALLLNQPLDGLVEVVKADSFRTKAAKSTRDAAKEAGMLVILQEDYDEIQAAIPLITGNLLSQGVILNGYTEATIAWDNDCLCRTRIDHLSKDFREIIDLKYSDRADDFVEHHIADMCYDMQGATEIEAVESLHPELSGSIAFSDVFIQTVEPYAVTVAEHTESMLYLGQAKWKRAKRTWIECLDSGQWPIGNRRIKVHAPNRAMDKEFGEEAR